MLYRMNLPTWERWGRGLIGVGLVVLGGDGAVGYSQAVKGRLHRARGLIREYLTGQRHTARLSHGDER
jgi:hypothetical protein